MKNQLLESVKLFYARDVSSAIDALNAHFVTLFGEQIIATNIVFNKIFEDENLLWEYFVQHYLNHQWTKKLSLGKIYQEIWTQFPSRKMPRLIGRLNLPFHTAFGETDKGYIQEDYRKAYEVLQLDELVLNLYEGLKSGKIHRLTYDDPYAIFPVIDDEYFTLLNLDQHGDLYKSKIKAAIEDGLAARLENYLDELEKFHFDYLCKILFQAFFFPPRETGLFTERVEGFQNQFPSQVELFPKALQNFSNSIQNNEALTEFIYNYTAGKVLAERPREWIRLFAKSIEEGKMLLTEI